jgi:MFS family permease
VWGAVAGAGGICGLVLAGLLVDAGSWRWIFLVNPPIALAVVVLTPRLTRESRDPSNPALDTRGAALGTLTVIALIYGLLRAADDGWTDSATLLPIALAIVLVPAFVWVERRAADPLVPLDFIAFPVRLVANVLNVVFAGAFFALSFLTMLHLQRDVGLTPLHAAVAYLPHGLALLSGVALSSWCANRIGVRTTVIGALLTAVAGTLLLGVSTDGATDATELVPGLVITGVASGLGFPLLAVSALAGTDETNTGLGSAVLSSSQQLGGAIGLAALVNVASGTRTGVPTAMFAIGGVLVSAALIATTLPEPPKEIP